MFGRINNINEMPERLYELCKIANEHSPILDDDLKDMFEPLWREENAPIYASLRSACVDLKLLSLNGDNKVTFCGNPSIVKTIESFRRYCNSVVWKDREDPFFLVAQVMLDSNERWLAITNLTDNAIVSEISHKTGLNSLEPGWLRRERFWISFLGFGYISERQNNIQFYPDMHVALRDLIVLSGLEKGKEYTAGEFFEKIRVVSSLGLPTNANKKLNLACSAGLRALHDSKEIELKRNPDSKDVWFLSKFENHAFVEEFTHIVIKEVK